MRWVISAGRRMEMQTTIDRLKLELSLKENEVQEAIEELIEAYMDEFDFITLDDLKGYLHGQPEGFHLGILCPRDHKSMGLRNKYPENTTYAMLDENDRLIIGGFVNNDRMQGESGVYVWQDRRSW